MKWAYENTEVDSYFPLYKYNKYLNQDWLWNLLNSIVYNQFQMSIKNALKERKDYH